MTDTDVSGRELDALVAQRIMGMKLDVAQRAPDGSPLALVELPRWSENPALARGIEFTLEQRHPGTNMRYESQSPFTVVISGPSGREYPATDPSEATAICRAMLAAMAGEGPGIPREQIQPSRSPRALNAMADLMSTRAQPHQPEGILMQAAALKLGEHKVGPARALLKYVATVKEIVPLVAEQVDQPDRDVALVCIHVLDRLLLAAEGARTALRKAAALEDQELASAARSALRSAGEA